MHKWKRHMFVAAALSAVLAFGGCAHLPRIPNLPEHVEAADQNLKAATGNLQQLLTMAAQAMDKVSRIEDEAARGGVVPASMDARFDVAMLAYARASQAASDGLVSGTIDSWPKLRALVDPVLARGQALIDMASDIGAIRSRVMDFLTQFRDILSAAAGEFLFGGGR